MKGVFVLAVMLVSFGGVFVFPVYAAIPETYTNDTFFESEQDAPATFTQDALGNFSGYTLTGKYFTQRAVVSDIHVRLQRFDIEEAHYYISGLGLIMADSDTIALSIYLARVGWQEAV